MIDEAGSPRRARPGERIRVRAMEDPGTKRVELLLPVRTILIVVAAIGLMVAFAAIGEHLPDRLHRHLPRARLRVPGAFRHERRRTGDAGWRRRSPCWEPRSAVVVLALLFLVPMVGSVRDFLHELPETIDQLRSSDELSWLGDTGIGGNARGRGKQHGGLGSGHDLGRPRHRRRLLRGLPRRVHDPLHLPLLPVPTSRT